MKRFIFLLLFFLLSIHIGPAFAQSNEPSNSNSQEKSDKYWQDLSRDLSRLQSMIEAINRNIERERSKLKVNVEYWDYPINEKISFMRASGKDVYSIVKKGRAKIPTMCFSSLGRQKRLPGRRVYSTIQKREVSE